MKRFRWIFNLLTLAALAYAVLEIKGFLQVNFVENDTRAKHQLNQFLNGKQPQPSRRAIAPETKNSEPSSLPQKPQE